MSTPASPAKRPPVAPANAATRPCRNVFIYGYCKNEGKGCPFNHDGSDRPPENTVVVSSPDQLKVLRTPGSVVGLAGAGGATDGGSGSPALMHPAYSPGVFTSEHFQQYRSTSQERGASATGPAPATSTPSSPLVTAAARAAARTAAAALNTAAATSARSREASTSRLIDGVSSLGLRSDGTADALATADVSMAVGYDETGLVAGGDSDAEGLDGYGHHDGGGYFPITVSTTSVAPANAELNHHLYFPLHPAHPPPKTGSRALSHFFVPEALRADLTRRTHAAVRPPSPATAASLPALLNGKYHTLVPLGATHSNGSGNGHDRGGNAVATMTKSADPVLGFPLHWYRATCSVDGSAVALCRVVGFRFASESVLRNVVDKWRKVVHPGIARLLEVFTVSGAWSGAASGESSLVLVYDYHAACVSLPSALAMTNPSAFGKGNTAGRGGSKPTAPPGASSAAGPYHPHSSASAGPNPLPPPQPVADRTLHSYAAQLVSAVATVHASGLALRSLVPSKLIVPAPRPPTPSGGGNKNAGSSNGSNKPAPAVSRARVRIAGVGIADFLVAAAAAAGGGAAGAGSSKQLTFGAATAAAGEEASNPGALEAAQQRDWRQVGLALAYIASGGKVFGNRGEAAAVAAATTGGGGGVGLGAVQEAMRAYPGFAGFVYYLVNPEMIKSAEEVVGMLGMGWVTEVDVLRVHSDRLENELAKELENGRLARLMIKLNFITERPEFSLGPRWSETGDRYLVTLFRDYVFHAVDGYGRPVPDVGHVLTCLNKLDAGVHETIMLTSRDERNCLIVSYAEIKHCIDETFKELVAASGVVPGTTAM